MRPARPRRGMISVAALVCLLVIVLICGSLLRLIHAERGLARNEQRRLQAVWLADSGLERAAARLADNPGYQGETWTLSAAEMEGPEPAVVTISIGPDPDPDRNRERQRLVTVVADYPVDPPQRARVRRRVRVDLGAPGGGSAP